MEENMNLDHGLQYDFIDFMGVGAQHDDYEISPVEQELDSAPENTNLDRGSPPSFIDFMGLGAQHAGDIDDPISQEPDPAQVHRQQRDSKCSDSNVDALLEDRVSSPMEFELLPPGKVEPDRPDDRTVRLDLDLDLRLLPESSMRLRQEGSQFLTLQLGPTSNPASDLADIS